MVNHAAELDGASRGEMRPAIARQVSGGAAVLSLSGAWTTRTAGQVDREMRTLEQESDHAITLDLRQISEMDTAGAWLIERLSRAAVARGAKLELRGAAHRHEVLLREAAGVPALAQGKQLGEGRSAVSRAFETLGHTAIELKQDFALSMHILGATISGAQMKHGRGHGVSFAAIVYQLDRMAVGALPVIVLMSFIIGAIIAQQGAFQLRYFGAEIFVVDLVGVLVLREIAVLLTAIMVAGRSGSAITAEIGSMKMREEIDALTVIGLNPIGVLVFPRLVALVIALPLLTIVSDVAGLAGAALVAQSYSGISISAFVSRLEEVVDLTTYFAGLIKAPFMALIIGIVASAEGMKVGGSAESLGRRVTASVVKSIFVVIVVDGLFAMFYAAIDF
jgi:phospholipid/cholesterol/gamma-HCH transport system permease protein